MAVLSLVEPRKLEKLAIAEDEKILHAGSHFEQLRSHTTREKK